MAPLPPLVPRCPRRGGSGLRGALLGAALLGGVLLAAHAEPDPHRDGAEPCRACRGLADSFSRVRGGGVGSDGGRGQGSTGGDGTEGSGVTQPLLGGAGGEGTGAGTAHGWQTWGTRSGGDSERGQRVE